MGTCFLCFMNKLLDLSSTGFDSQMCAHFIHCLFVTLKYFFFTISKLKACYFQVNYMSNILRKISANYEVQVFPFLDQHTLVLNNTAKCEIFSLP